MKGAIIAIGIVVLLLSMVVAVMGAIFVGLIQDWQDVDTRSKDNEIRIANLAEAGRMQDKQIKELKQQTK